MSQGGNDWWTFHGDTDRSGFVSDSPINASNVSKLKALHTLQLGGPVLSTPAVVGGFIYVGTANGTQSDGQPDPDGGSLHKIDLAAGTIVATFHWPTNRDEGDTHGFTGMGCTPAVVGGRVYFSAFNGKVYCLDAASLALIWQTDIRVADPGQNQPITNVSHPSSPQAEGWCSPLVVNGRVYVGIGEGENPDLYSFIFCLDAGTGRVIWIFCTCQYEQDKENEPNVLPADVIKGTLPPMFSTTSVGPVAKGCSVWSAISYDAGLGRIFCATGNPQPENPPPGTNTLPAPGYAYSILALDADTGKLLGKVQAIPESSYRISDTDIDFGTSPTLFTRGGRRVLGIGCKNGGFFVVNAETMAIVAWRQLLPYDNAGNQIPTVDPHGPDTSTNPNPNIPNADSNMFPEENFHGTYSSAAVHPGLGRVFIGIGGNNYHFIAAGIDTATTPFLRAMSWDTLDDAWAMDNGDPRKYVKPTPPMYTTVGEAGLCSPAVVNDVVFCSTTKVSLYAFDANDGSPLWSDDLGMQTGGFSGGYGYCLGPAIAGGYVVAGALIAGRDGGILRIYSLGQ